MLPVRGRIGHASVGSDPRMQPVTTGGGMTMARLRSTLATLAWTAAPVALVIVTMGRRWIS